MISIIITKKCFFPLPILDIEDGIITEVTDDAPLNMLLPSNINPEIRITEVRRVTPSNTASPSIIIIIIIIIIK